MTRADTARKGNNGDAKAVGVGNQCGGRSYERFALQATALGIRTAMLNQTVEVIGQRAEFAQFLGLGQCRPDLFVRFGREPLMPRSLRRPGDAAMTLAIGS